MGRIRHNPSSNLFQSSSISRFLVFNFIFTSSSYHLFESGYTYHAGSKLPDVYHVSFSFVLKNFYKNILIFLKKKICYLAFSIVMKLSELIFVIYDNLIMSRPKVITKCVHTHTHTEERRLNGEREKHNN